MHDSVEAQALVKDAIRTLCEAKELLEDKDLIAVADIMNFMGRICHAWGSYDRETICGWLGYAIDTLANVKMSLEKKTKEGK